jgi:hypothetical protein
VSATAGTALKPPTIREDERKVVGAQSACTNVPRPTLTVADALAALRAAVAGQGDTRTIRRALLEALAAINDDD